jgi:hypothetical protein
MKSIFVSSDTFLLPKELNLKKKSNVKNTHNCRHFPLKAFSKADKAITYLHARCIEHIGIPTVISQPLLLPLRVEAAPKPKLKPHNMQFNFEILKYRHKIARCVLCKLRCMFMA